MLSLLQAVAALGTRAVGRAAATMATVLLAGSLMLVSLGFFTLAGYRALAPAIGDVLAPLAIGIAYLVAGLVALVIVQSRR